MQEYSFQELSPEQMERFLSKNKQKVLRKGRVCLETDEDQRLFLSYLEALRNGNTLYRPERLKFVDTSQQERSQ